MQLHYSDHFVLPLPEGHRFPMRKYRDLHEALAVALPQARFVEAPAASPGELALAHAPSYVEAVLHGHLSAAQQREIGFPWSPLMAERSRRSVGATIAAARAALHEGVSANLAGGTHHASAEAGSGFCVFNDVAVATRLMQAEWHRHHRRLLRVAVIDLDVHQGNGTAAILADDPTVWTLSLHGQHNFPFRKVAGDDDVALPDGCGDADYLAALDAALARLWAAHPDGLPGLVFYNAGADVHEGDRLGRLKLTAAGVAERDRRVYAALRERGIPVAVCMGGGYGVDLAQTVAVQRRTLELAWDDWLARGARRDGALRGPT
jgi:acetoin utilization deacetylase AcuC-like enzyme